ncbi:class I adenylate-forming enzyme family protein [Brevibacterium litoralis]|uniref:class I adenylate-forming enzyme family protein n=1 Tax=Brevibacterium litoralis TaxID=3138935 RepID=UPI0032EF14CC
MSWFDERPWLKTIADDDRLSREIPETTTLHLFERAVENHPERPAILYYGYTPSWADLDAQTDAFAAYLQDKGLQRGDRIGIYLQNTPHFFVAAFGIWKAGGTVVPLNPMYRDELAHVLSDSGAKGIVVSAAAFADRVKDYTGDLSIVVTCNDKDYAVEPPQAVFGVYPDSIPTGHDDFKTVVEEYAGRGYSRVGRDQPAFTPDDEGIIGYTSGTSGLSKGAKVTHRGLTVNGQMLGINQDFDETAVIYTLAPVFHITGFVCQFLAAVACGAALSMNHRFEPASALETFERDKPNYMAGPSTAYMALLAHPDFSREAFSSFTSVMSGGAPLPEAIVKKFEERTGHYIGQGYGLTETTAQIATVPLGMRAPVDPDSGNLSCGLPLASVMIRIRDEDGKELGPHEVGEICTSGPQVVPEYINNAEATAKDIPDGELHTGDVGFMDEQGWVFIVDRKKDMINASGFKVWPREVEDVLYTHPAVLEAAVVGAPDEYRGENVVAFVSLQGDAKTDGSVTEADIVEYCRKHLASYKAPREVRFVDALPKTSSGKILRREMRDVAAKA